VTAPVSEADLLAVESFFRGNGLPHLTADGRPGVSVARWRAGFLVCWSALFGLVSRLGLSWWEIGLTALGMLVLGLAVSYVLFDLGALALFVHQGSPVLHGLRDSAMIAIRALPPLLAVLLFLSLATETWRAFGRLEGWRYGSVLIAFGILSAAILVGGLARERRALFAPAPGEDLARAARATPAAGLVDAGVVPEAPPLGSLARVNVTVALLVSLGVRVLAVGLVVCGAFLLFGMLIVDRALTTEWVGVAPHVLISVSIGGREVIISEALVRVATTLGAFASLYFAGVALGDARNREEFLDDELDRLGGVMAAWAYYRGALSPAAEPPGADG
jgi:hypothetical protein